MNDWLSEIEDNQKYARAYNELEVGREILETPSERMARVIRELARAVVVYRGALLSCSLGALVQVHEENILSPDTKELLELVNTSVASSDSAEE